MGQDHAGRSNRRAASYVRSVGGGSFNFRLGWHGAGGTLLGRWLAKLAVLDDMDCPRSERVEYGVELDHTLERRTQTMGTDHDDHVPPSRRGFLALIASGTYNLSGNPVVNKLQQTAGIQPLSP